MSFDLKPRRIYVNFFKCLSLNHLTDVTYEWVWPSSKIVKKKKNFFLFYTCIKEVSLSTGKN